MSKDYDAPAMARREPVISERDRAAIGEAARRELRDRFAMAALTGLLANGGFYLANHLEQRAKTAWAEADAMLKARDAGKDEQ